MDTPVSPVDEQRSSVAVAAVAVVVVAAAAAADQQMRLTALSAPSVKVVSVMRLLLR